jgi:hypothetical protein
LHNPHFANKARSHSQSGVNKGGEDVDLDEPLPVVHARNSGFVHSVLSPNI